MEAPGEGMGRLEPAAAQALGLAWGFGWRVGAGLFIGYHIDQWAGTSPLFLAVFAIGSLVAGVAELLRLARRRPSEATDPTRDNGALR